MERTAEKTCCFTGHRRIDNNDIIQIRQRVENEVILLIKNGYKYFDAGGAIGFDTIAAQTVLHLQKTYPQIELTLVLPCKTQSNSWDAENKRVYNEIITQANNIIYTSPTYFRGCMHKRNRYMVDNSSVCICYLNNSSGGTKYTVNYAEKTGRKIINIFELMR